MQRDGHCDFEWIDDGPGFPNVSSKAGLVKALQGILPGSNFDAVCCKGGNVIGTVPCDAFAMA